MARCRAPSWSPFFRGLSNDAGQATGLISPWGALPLRDSAGIQPDFAGLRVTRYRGYE